MHLTLPSTADGGPGAEPTYARLYYYSLPDSASLKTLAGIGNTLKNRPKIVRYIANDNPKEARDARSGR